MKRIVIANLILLSAIGFTLALHFTAPQIRRADAMRGIAEMPSLDIVFDRASNAVRFASAAPDAGMKADEFERNERWEEMFGGNPFEGTWCPEQPSLQPLR